MDFRVLGALEVWRGTERVPVPGARRQRVLAALLLAPNAVVPLSRLAEMTWDDEPPASAVKQLRNSVSALRERLGDSAQRLILTEEPGYRIRVGEQDLDSLRFAVDLALDRYALHLVDALGFLVLMGGWEERVDTATAGLRAARRSGLTEHEANVLLARGEALVQMRHPDAEPDLTRASTLAEEIGNLHLQIAARTELGQLLRRQTRFAEALGHFDEVRVLSRGFDTGRWEAVAEGNLARLHADLGHHRQAVEHGTRSARLRRRLGDTDGEACALAVIARGLQGLGDHDTAVVHCRRAVALGRASLGSHDETLAWPLAVLATSLNHLGRVTEAVGCRREAAAIYTDRGLDADAAAMRHHIRTAEPAPGGPRPAGCVADRGLAR
ncbi:tetratricopeptide repeat protein [Streptomyces griseoviridis]|uniref:tetratricopeptide repeat protein n=1 Tax=Streptomyces griseoviridis TaxID=45398 RepID=UPI00340F697F